MVATVLNFASLKVARSWEGAKATAAARMTNEPKTRGVEILR